MPAPIGECRLCSETTSLAESHILPEFFYEGTYDDSGRFISVSSHPHHRPRPMQRGLTERLLCIPCEHKISRFETYAAGLLRRVDNASDSQIAIASGVQIEGVDFQMLRLFGLSLLWRMHESRQHMFAAVRLGARAPALRSMLLVEDPGSPHEFGFAMAKIVGLDTHGSMIIAPLEHRLRECRMYVLMARGFEWIFATNSNSQMLTGYMPFIGESSQLQVPFIHQDRDTLFASIRRAFPNHLGGRRTGRR